MCDPDTPGVAAGCGGETKNGRKCDSSCQLKDWTAPSLTATGPAGWITDDFGITIRESDDQNFADDSDITCTYSSKALRYNGQSVTMNRMADGSDYLLALRYALPRLCNQPLNVFVGGTQTYILPNCPYQGRGACIFYINATDRSLQKNSIVRQLTFNIDSIKPVLGSFSVTGTGNTKTITVTGRDVKPTGGGASTISGIKSVSIEVFNVVGISIASRTCSESTESVETLECTLGPREYTAGRYDIKISGQDYAGNSFERWQNSCGGAAPITTEGTVIGKDRYPSDYTLVIWTYAPDATSETPCKWKCEDIGNDDYHKRPASAACDPDVRYITCGAKSQNTVWNSIYTGINEDKYKQTWSVANTRYEPITAPATEYSDTKGECHYIAASGWHRDPDTGEIERNTRPCSLQCLNGQGQEGTQTWAVAQEIWGPCELNGQRSGCKSCDPFYHPVGGVGGTCAANTCSSSLTGIPTGAQLCAGDGTEVPTDGLANRFVTACTDATKCEYAPPDGTHDDPDTGTIEPNIRDCTAECVNGIGAVGKERWISAPPPGRWEGVCKSEATGNPVTGCARCDPDYHPDGRGGCAKNECTGDPPAGSSRCSSDDFMNIGGNMDVASRLRENFASCSAEKCEYYCTPGKHPNPAGTRCEDDIIYTACAEKPSTSVWNSIYTGSNVDKYKQTWSITNSRYEPLLADKPKTSYSIGADECKWNIVLCPEGTTLCADYTCQANCDNNGGNPPSVDDGVCDPLESCASQDCDNRQDSCQAGLVCDFDLQVCTEPPIVPTQPPSCTGEDPADAQQCSNDANPATDTPKTLVSLCSAPEGPKCEYICNDEHHPYDSDDGIEGFDTCVSDTCIGEDPPADSEQGESTVTGEQAEWTQFDSGIAREDLLLCEWSCPFGEHYDGISACVSDDCIETPPSGSIQSTFNRVTGEETEWHIDSTPDTLPTELCEWQCPDGTHFDGVNKCASDTCKGTPPTGATLSTLTDVTGAETAWTQRTSLGTLGVCEWRCEGDTHFDFITNECASNTCGGTAPTTTTGTAKGDGTVEGAAEDWGYGAGLTDQQVRDSNCKWKCTDGYHQIDSNGDGTPDGNGCEQNVCINVPDGAEECTSGEILTENTDSVLLSYESVCTDAMKCDYYCPADTHPYNNECVPDRCGDESGDVPLTGGGIITGTDDVEGAADNWNYSQDLSDDDIMLSSCKWKCDAFYHPVDDSENGREDGCETNLCSDKPPNSEWNSIHTGEDADKYQKIWNPSTKEYEPAIAPVTSYSDAPGECKWVCDAQSELNADQTACDLIVVPDVVNGACRSVADSRTAPVSSCTQGNPSPSTAVTSLDDLSKWAWICEGSGPGASSPTCTSNRITNAACGSDNGKTLPSAPTNLCSDSELSGSISPTATGWSWACKGYNNAASTSPCSATQSVDVVPTVNGACRSVADSRTAPVSSC
ncbi:MAG: hypothetical protein QMD85_01020, partial [Candidatus Aenigmarchaeota archaeon]|nr:hypothetical protein [Candidatus Aenigmarchaeota archaeon]